MIKTIAIDFDGVCGGLLEIWLKIYNRDWDDTLECKDILDWHIHKFVKPECGLRMYEYIEDPKIYDYVFPIEGSVAGVLELYMMKYQVRFVTHATEGHKGRKREWLGDYGFLAYDNQYFEMEDKSNFPADYLLDDYIKNVSDFKGQGVLFSAPYNRHCLFTPRVENWEEAVRFFKKELEKNG